MDYELIKNIRIRTIIALFSDDLLMKKLVLKGGSAIELVYKASQRSSLDLDFSMENDFDEEEKENMENKICNLIKNEIESINYKIFDCKLECRPQRDNNGDWGGYKIEFKVIAKEKFNEQNIQNMRRQSISINNKSHKKFVIDISKNECVKKEQKFLEDYVIFVYTINLIIIEKIRAICQQNPLYKKIKNTISIRPRARDFYDIYILMKNKQRDLFIDQNKDLLKEVFNKKNVSLEYLLQVNKQFDLHNSDFSSLRDTIPKEEDLLPFRKYFEYTVKLCEDFYKSIYEG